jgi:hypothetical protein
VLLDWIFIGLDGIRMKVRWIRSTWPSLLDGLDRCPKIQLNPIAAKGKHVHSSGFQRLVFGGSRDIDRLDLNGNEELLEDDDGGGGI